MRRKVIVATFLTIATSAGERRTIDTQKSVLTVRVYKSGLFSAFAHDHEIRAPISKGELDDSAEASVEFRVNAGDLRVIDPQVSPKDRAEIQKTMEGPSVLDIAKFAEIRFRSNAVQKMGTNRWNVRGELTLHGQTRPVAVEVSQENGHYTGTAMLKQRDFGITPVSIAGGTVKVKDQVKIEFDITTAP